MLTCLLLPAEVWRDRRSHVDVRAPIRRPCWLCVCNLAMSHPHIVAPTAFHTMIWNTAKAFQSFVFFPPRGVRQQHNVHVIFAQYSPSPSSSRSTLRKGRLRFRLSFPCQPQSGCLFLRCFSWLHLGGAASKNLKPQLAFFRNETYFTLPLDFRDCFPTWRTAFLSASAGR